MSKKRQSQAWKALEREAAAELDGKRISRGDNFARVDVDVVVKDFPRLKIDGKYRTRHAHHTFMKEIAEKYVTKEGQEPVLVTKHHRQKGAFATVDLRFLGDVLKMLREQNEALTRVQQMAEADGTGYHFVDDVVQKFKRFRKGKK